MSVEHSQPYGTPQRRAEGEYLASSMPGAIDAPGEHGRPGGPRPSTPPPMPQARTPRRRARWALLIAATLILALVLGAAGSLFYIDRSYADRIYPNVSIRGVAVGEMSTAQARAALEERFAPFLAQPVTLTYGDRSWTPTMAELGVSLEIERAIAEAFAAGRDNSLVDNVRQVAAVWQNGLELPLHVTIDQDAMQAYLLGRVAEVERPAVDARLELDGTLVSVLPGSPGQQVLVAETLQEITAGLQSLDAQTVALRTRELQPRLSDTAASAAQERIAALLAGPITLTVGERQFEWPLSDLARLVRVERTADAAGDGLAVSVDTGLIGEKIAALAGETEVKGAYPRVDWNGGDLQISREGTSGLRIDEDVAAELVLSALAAPAEQRTLELPMRETAPPVTADNLAQLGITELLSVGRSDFSGSAPYRITNIKAGMRQLQGILLAPGEEFSFNNSVGAIDASNGFVEGYAIVQNRTQLEWGGGICQDSTTMFRAAFWAGLPITERHGHSFYISWYDKFAFADYGNGPGMDAAIFTGALDLKFVNDTGNWLLIQTGTSGSSAEVRIYGTSDGREVSLIGPTIRDRVPAPTEPVYVAEPSRPRGSPRQSDTARGGMTIDFTRVIERDGQVVEQRTFQTRFRPWPNIFEVNPADLGPDGKPRPAATATADPALLPTADPALLPTTDPNVQPQPDPIVQPEPQPEPQPQPEPPALPTAQPIESVPVPAPPPGDGSGG